MTKTKKMMMSLLLGLAMIACALLLTACGGSGNKTLDVKGKRFEFDKAKVEWSASATQEQKAEALAKYILENPTKPNATEADLFAFEEQAYAEEYNRTKLEFTNEGNAQSYYETFEEPMMVYYFIQNGKVIELYENEGDTTTVGTLNVTSDRLIQTEEVKIYMVKLFFKEII